MVIGLLELRISLPESRSLKDKRMVLKSVKDCIHNRFNVSVAEVAAHDDRRFAQLAVAVVSVDRVHAHKVLEAVAGYVGGRGDAVLMDYGIQMI